MFRIINVGIGYLYPKRYVVETPMGESYLKINHYANCCFVHPWSNCCYAHLDADHKLEAMLHLPEDLY